MTAQHLVFSSEKNSNLMELDFPLAESLERMGTDAVKAIIKKDLNHGFDVDFYFWDFNDLLSEGCYFIMFDYTITIPSPRNQVELFSLIAEIKDSFNVEKITLTDYQIKFNCQAFDGPTVYTTNDVIGVIEDKFVQEINARLPHRGIKDIHIKFLISQCFE